MRLHFLWAFTAALLLVSCGPSGPGPYQVVVLVYNSGEGVYEPRTVTLTTPTDIAKLQGSVAKLVGGSKFNEKDAVGNTVAEALQNFTKNPGSDVNASYIESQDPDTGTRALVPADFHSLAMATTYYNFERAHSFITERIGGTINEKRYGVPKVYYFTEYVSLDGITVTDNAMYAPLAQSFFIMPFQTFQQVPMAINHGIVAHEFGHSMFNYNVFGSSPYPGVLDNWASDFGGTPGLNLIAALEEGAADVFGTGATCSDDLVTCDTEFMGSSLNEEILSARRVDGVHCMTQTMWDNLETLGHENFLDAKNYCEPWGCNYTIGSVFASAMWAASQDKPVTDKLGQSGARRQMFQALWNAEGGASGSTSWKDLVDSAQVQSQFSLKKSASSSLPSVLDAVIAGAEDPTLKRALCSAFIDRFDLARTDFKDCPDAQSMGKCAR
ncbi:MAG: hypothetical protein QM765_03050 [Myxococcales bacterium]